MHRPANSNPTMHRSRPAARAMVPAQLACRSRAIEPRNTSGTWATSASTSPASSRCTPNGPWAYPNYPAPPGDVPEPPHRAAAAARCRHRRSSRDPLNRVTPHGGTVNEVILATVAGAPRARLGVMPVALPTGDDPAARMTRIGAITRQRKTAARGTSTALLGLPFWLLAPTGLLRW
jgi:hypothetical protein